MDYDIAVIGAGPAGSTAARECAKAGLKTLLLEREAFPRYKPCGGGLTAKTLETLGFSIPEELIQLRTKGVRFHYKGKTAEYTGKDTLITMVERPGFDGFLAEKAVEAGAVFMDGTPVEDIVFDEKGCAVKTSKGVFEAEAIVGADGIMSMAAAKVRRPLKADEVILAFEAEVAADETTIKGLGQFTDIYFDTDCCGYGWVFPKKRHISVGLGGILDGFREPRKAFDSYLKALGIDIGDAAVHAHMLPIGNNTRENAHGRMLLVGDAAGFTEPLTGEGIYYAIRSGQYAAQTLAAAHARRDYSKASLMEYSLRCNSEFGEEFRRACKAMREFFRLKPLSMRILFQNRDIVEQYERIQSGKSTYKEFKQWIKPRIPRMLIKAAI